MKVELAVSIVTAELARAQAKFAPFNSPHEGYAVIKEELDELWERVRTKPGGRTTDAMGEAMQVAAMGLRYLVNLGCDEVGHVIAAMHADESRFGYRARSGEIAAGTSAEVAADAVAGKPAGGPAA